MKYRSAPLFVLALALTLSLDAPAQTESRSATVYRCGKDGRELRDAPCPDSGNGKAKAAAEQIAYDEPNASDAQAARQRADRDARHAEALRRDRLKQEADARHRPGAGHLSAAAAPAKPASAPQPLVTKKPRPHKPHKPKTTAG